MATENENSDAARAIVLTGFAITGLLELVVVGTCCYLWMTGTKELPKELGGLLVAITTFAFVTIPQQISKYLETVTKKV